MATLLAASSLLLAASAPRPGGVTLLLPAPAPTPRNAAARTRRLSRPRAVLFRNDEDGEDEQTKTTTKAETEPTTDDTLAAVASLRALFDQQRSSQTPEQASEPSSAGIRAASAAALDAVASADPAASASLLAAKRRAEKLVLHSLHKRQFPQDCSKARFLVGAIDKFCGFACQIHHAVHLLAAAAATNR